MEQKSMTALVSAFARWHHAAHNDVNIFDDSAAGKLLYDEEKQQIAGSMLNGIGFFNPSFTGTEEEALGWIVSNQLSPSPLGRSAFAECALREAIGRDIKQYVIVAAGYDTFACRRPAWANGLRVFELDSPAMIADKQKRVREVWGKIPRDVTFVPIDLTAESVSEKLRAFNAFDENAPSFYSLLGISYYLTKANLIALLDDIAGISQNGSTIALDYPDELTYTERAGERAKKQAMLARGAGEAMLASYSFDEIEKMLSDRGFVISEHQMPDEITERYFGEYNKANPEHAMAAFDNVNYCLAAKRPL